MIGPRNIFIHMTAMPDGAWRAVADKGAQVSIAVPTEMTMRHGMPPILMAMALRNEPSLSTDVNCTMTADFFIQMRGMMTLQRMLVNERALAGDKDLPELLTARDIVNKSDVGAADYVYGTGNAYDDNGNMVSGAGRTIAWTGFDKPATIADAATATSFAYGADRERVVQTRVQGAATTEIVYVAGLFERVRETGEATKSVHYIFAEVSDSLCN